MYKAYPKMKVIAYVASELAQDSSFLNWCNWFMEQVPTINIREYSDISSDLYTSTLLISNSNDTIRKASCSGIACVGYVPNRDKFLKVKYVIEGFDSIDYDYLDGVFKRFHHIPWTICETEHCYLRELTLDDIDALFELYSKPGMTDYVEPLYPYEEELEYEKKYIECMYDYFEYGMWLVFDKNTNQLIGRAGLEHREYPASSEGQEEYPTFSQPSTELEMGYMIDPSFQRQGLATEVCSAIIDYAKEKTDFDRLCCLIHSDNFASIALVKKLGFEYIDNCDISGNMLERYVLNLKQ